MFHSFYIILSKVLLALLCGLLMGRPQTKRVRIVDTTPQYAHGYDGRARAEKGYAHLYRQRPDREGNNGGWPRKDYETAALSDAHTNGNGATASSMRRPHESASKATRWFAYLRAQIKNIFNGISSIPERRNFVSEISVEV